LKKKKKSKKKSRTRERGTKMGKECSHETRQDSERPASKAEGKKGMRYPRDGEKKKLGINKKEKKSKASVRTAYQNLGLSGRRCGEEGRMWEGKSRVVRRKSKSEDELGMPRRPSRRGKWTRKLQSVRSEGTV